MERAFGEPRSKLQPGDPALGHETPLTNLTVATMAQIYPEDRGTNYAVRDGRAVAARLFERLRCSLAPGPLSGSIEFASILRGPPKKAGTAG